MKSIISARVAVRRTLLRGMALFVVAGSPAALAADAPVIKSPPPNAAALFNWSGFYAGGHVGYGWGRGDDDVVLVPAPAPYSARVSMDGWVGGLQGGYNVRSGNWVAGVTADISLADIHGDGFVGPFLPVAGGGLAGGSRHIASQTIDRFGTLRARVGVVAFDRLMAFVSGGLSFGRVKFASDTFYGPFITSYVASESKWKAGWTLGGGFEWSIGAGWSLLAEYLYYDLGHTTVLANPAPAGAPAPLSNRWTSEGHIVRLGANYKFGGPM